MKYAVIVIVLAILAGGGYLWWHQHQLAAAEAGASAVQTAKVEYNDIKVSVQSTGAVASNRDVDIKCKASGNITVLPYTDVSATVAPGALLMQLETTDEQRLLDSANAVVAADRARLTEAQLNWQIAKMSLETTRQKDEADLASSKAHLNDAKSKAERTQSLFNEQLASKEDLETAVTTQAQAEADAKTAGAAIEELKQSEIGIEAKNQEIAQMSAQLDQDISKSKTAQQNVDYCTVYAPDAAKKSDWWPFDSDEIPEWKISKMTVGVAVGYLVQSGSSGTSGGTTVMTLSDMSHVFVLATVAESDIGALLMKFDAGQELPVTITADAYQGVQFSGKVVRIAQIGLNTSNVVTFEVKIEVTSANRMLLRPVMTANVEIIRAQRGHVLTIPVQAFMRKRNDADSQPAGNMAAAPAADNSASSQPATRPGRKGGKKRPKDSMPKSDEAPTSGTVVVVKPDGTTETRDVVVGLSDDTTYEVLSGLSEEETVQLQKLGADSRWKGGGGGGGRGGAGSMMRGIGR